MSALKPVLIIGGSGSVGARMAATLRKLHPDLPIAIGGRDMDKARKVAAGLGKATAVPVDVSRPDLGQPDGSFGALVAFLYDDTLNLIRHAQAHQIPYIGISTGIHEIGPEVMQFAFAPNTAPIVMGSGWGAGAVGLAALKFTRDFASVDSLEMSALLDEQDLGGPAAESDYQRLVAIPYALQRQDGRWRWTPAGEQGRTLTALDGRKLAAQTYSPFDVYTLAAATGARNVRFDFVLGETSSRRRGEPFSTEALVEIEGTGKDGKPARRRYELMHPQGQAPLTALTVALLVERLLGLAGGDPAAPGLYFPETLIDPAYAVRRFEEYGLKLSTSPAI